MDTVAYSRAQYAWTELKVSVLELLKNNFPNGARNKDVGVSLGIYCGHVGHEGHVPRTLLQVLQEEGLVVQDDNKLWHLKKSTD